MWWASRIDALPFHIVQAHDDIENLKRIRGPPGILQVYVDTPGWIDLNAGDSGADPLGRGPAADALRAVLDVADDIIVPIETNPSPSTRRLRTINKVIKPQAALPRRHQQLGPPGRHPRP